MASCPRHRDTIISHCGKEALLVVWRLASYMHLVGARCG